MRTLLRVGGQLDQRVRMHSVLAIVENKVCSTSPIRGRVSTDVCLRHATHFVINHRGMCRDITQWVNSTTLSEKR